VETLSRGSNGIAMAKSCAVVDESPSKTVGKRSSPLTFDPVRFDPQRLIRSLSFSLSDSKMSRLEISRVESSDSGYYECRAMNVASRQPAAAKTRLIVTLPPKRNANKAAPSSHHLIPIPRNKSRFNNIIPGHHSGSSTTAANLWPLMGRSCPVEDYCLNGGTCIFFENVIEYVCQ
jgi:hypothetical protein